MVSADFKSIILDANTSIQKINAVLEEVENGTGTMNKLLHDESLYIELVESNKNFRPCGRPHSSSGKVYSFFFVGFKNERDNIES